MIGYFDSSVILAILFNEKKQEEALKYWNDTDTKISSILLKIETIISLRRVYNNNKQKLDNDWLVEKIKDLNEYLKEINYRIIDEELEVYISSNNDLAKCRSLDAIHIATALEYRNNNNNENISLYSFDIDMHELALKYGFLTNTL
jgi:predicted nucleic acid-binding protein